MKTEKAKLFFTVWAMPAELGFLTSLQGREKHGSYLIPEGQQEEEIVVFAEIWVSQSVFS